LHTQTVAAQESRQLAVSVANGLRLLVAEENTDPELRVVLPGRPSSDEAIRGLFPEHVTVLKHGDGVRFRYQFSNQTTDVYDMVTAVTDPRLTSLFFDRRLERTFVHHADGFDLLASETPSRLTAPLSEWLPVRYLASFRWPIPAQRTERRADGVTCIYKSRSVDEPFVVTQSSDGAWVVASFAREAGNVWSNPALTCQPVDPQTSLGARQTTTLEIKMLVLRASLDDALRIAREQRPSLR
jgi:hypothetical protein